MLNKLKHFANSIIGSSFSVDVIVNSPEQGHYFGYITEIPNRENILFVFAGNDYEIINIDSVLKIDNVYHIKSGNSDYTIRIM